VTGLAGAGRLGLGRSWPRRGLAGARRPSVNAIARKNKINKYITKGNNNGEKLKK
jgi:hypothetical protein